MLRSFGATAILVVICLFGAAPGNAQTAKPKWALDGTGAFCTLSRTIEDAPAASPTHTTLLVRTYPGTGQSAFMLIRGTAPVIGHPTPDMTIGFDSAGASYARPVSIIALGQAGKAITVDYLPPSFLEEFAEASVVNVAVGKTVIGSYAIPGAAKAVDAFRECETAKLTEWGADPAEFEPGGRRPMPEGESQKWIGFADLRLPRNVAGTFAAFAIARLTIGTDGHVEACAVIDSNQNTNLNSVACKLLTDRARYAPARDKDGKPVRSVALYRAQWSLENTITWEKF
jgi:hypothetical protein